MTHSEAKATHAGICESCSTPSIMTPTLVKLRAEWADASTHRIADAMADEFHNAEVAKDAAERARRLKRANELLTLLCDRNGRDLVRRQETRSRMMGGEKR